MFLLHPLVKSVGLAVLLRMAFILALDTATEVCSVALFNNNQQLQLTEIEEGNTHANMLTTLIESVVTKAGITLQQLDAVCVSMGPGSYTGLRVGVSTAKGLCYTLKKPLIAINTLQSLAQVFINQNPTYTGLICPMIDARRMEVFAAAYATNLQEAMATQAVIVDSTSFADLLTQNTVAFIGNGAAKCQQTLTHANAQFYTAIKCSASGLGQLAYTKFCENAFEDVAYFEPFYLKDFVATTPKNKF